MSNLKRHVGRIRNTDRRCVVVYMQIPGTPDHALVVDTDALPDNLHDALQEVVQSHEGQNTVDIANLLARRIVPHLGVDILNVLHARGSLQRVPVDNIVMYPSPNSPFPLRQIIEMMGGSVGQAAAQTPVDPSIQNRHAENHKAAAAEEQLAVANNILIQARDLEAQAAAKREQAYQLAPSLRPNQAAPAAPIPHDGDAQLAMEDGAATVLVRPGSEPVIEEATPELVTGGTDGITYSITPEAIAEAKELGLDLEAEVRRAVELQAALEQQFREEAIESESAQAEEAQQVDVDAEEEISPAHGIDLDDAKLQEFLDRAAYRADKEAGELAAQQAPKRPVGRPRKDGQPAGSVKK